MNYIYRALVSRISPRILMISGEVVMPWFMRLVADPSWRSPGIDPSPVNVGFMVDKITLGQVSLWLLRFSPRWNYSFSDSYSFTYHRQYITLESGRTVKSNTWQQTKFLELQLAVLYFCIWLICTHLHKVYNIRIWQCSWMVNWSDFVEIDHGLWWSCVTEIVTWIEENFWITGLQNMKQNY